MICAIDLIILIENRLIKLTNKCSYFYLANDRKQVIVKIGFETRYKTFRPKRIIIMNFIYIRRKCSE